MKFPSLALCVFSVVLCETIITRRFTDKTRRTTEKNENGHDSPVKDFYE
jgi:hypothetical protein